MENSNIIPFGGKEIRKILHNEEWFFSVIDVIDILTDSPIPRNYWSDLKRREPQLHESCVQLKLLATDGRQRLTDCANTKGILRIVMSIPSQKAEPLKLWLAEQGERTIEETENPELLTQRQIELYKAKGYPDEWIKERINSIDTRNKLTEEWQKRTSVAQLCLAIFVRASFKTRNTWWRTSEATSISGGSSGSSIWQRTPAA